MWFASVPSLFAERRFLRPTCCVSHGSSLAWWISLCLCRIARCFSRLMGADVLHVGCETGETFMSRSSFSVICLRKTYCYLHSQDVAMLRGKPRTQSMRVELKATQISGASHHCFLVGASYQGPCSSCALGCAGGWHVRYAQVRDPLI